MGKKGEETKRLIREKAISLFAQKGFKNVTMKDICCETGLSRGGLYRHYDSTRQIFSEIVNELMSAQDNELSEKMNQGRPAPQILEEILGDFGLEITDTTETRFHCDCSKERVSRALSTLSKKDLDSIIADGESIEVKCQFCNKAYEFTVDELKEMR